MTSRKANLEQLTFGSNYRFTSARIQAGNLVFSMRCTGGVCLKMKRRGARLVYT